VGAEADGQDPEGTQPPEAGPADRFGPDYEPEEWEFEGPAVSISLGDAADLDPALLAAVTGPDGLGGNALCAAYEQDAAADVLRPGPILAALTEQAVGDLGRLDDEQLMGVLSAARRLENRATYLQTVMIAEFARRRAAQAGEAAARRSRPGTRSGDFPDAELSMELLITRGDAARWLDVAADLTTRLPKTLAGMAAGSIDYGRAVTAVFYTAGLGDADAAHADEILAAAAPGLRQDQLARKAFALEMKLDPQAAKDRKERAATHDRRVEVRREQSGNASIAGRELPTADAMASKSYLDAVAARLRVAGVDGTLDHLRALALTELTQGRDPLRSLTTDPTPGAAAPASPGTDAQGPNAQSPDAAPDASPAGTEDPLDPLDPLDPSDPSDASSRPVAAPASGPHTPAYPRTTAPFPATINLTIPVGTLLGWSSAPAWAGSWGLLDPDDTRDIVRAASQDPRTRWCYTIIGPNGTAIAHACSRGQHPWGPPDTGNSSQPRNPPDAGSPPGPRDPSSPHSPPDPEPPPGSEHPPVGDGPDPAQAAQLHDLLRRLKADPEPIARDTCGHHHTEDHYTPSRKLQHLIRARTATCTAPACNAQAAFCDLDHTIPYPDGPTDECNIDPKCRRHHRVKQAPGWRVEQPQPGIMRWTTPSGRTHTTTPTVYDC
jgi:hypothetical protein